MSLRAAALAGTLAVAASALAATTALPPPPARYFNDDAHVVTPEVAERLDAKLKRFDEETSNQIVVAVFPELPSPSLEDFTIRTAQAWRVGRTKLANGVVLFVFVKDHRVRMEVGYGLEGVLPDILANRVIEEQIVPSFRGGDYATGLERGVDAIMSATRGEYRPPSTARTGPARRAAPNLTSLIVLGFVVFFFIRPMLFGRRGRTYSRRGWYGGGPWWMGGGGWGGGGFGGGGFGGGGFGGGGGGFSGGGGSFGGGGASGSW